MQTSGAGTSSGNQNFKDSAIATTSSSNKDATAIKGIGSSSTNSSATSSSSTSGMNNNASAQYVKTSSELNANVVDSGRCCFGCGVPCTQTVATPNGPMCNSCHHHWRYSSAQLIDANILFFFFFLNKKNNLISSTLSIYLSLSRSMNTSTCHSRIANHAHSSFRSTKPNGTRISIFEPYFSIFSLKKIQKQMHKFQLNTFQSSEFVDLVSRVRAYVRVLVSMCLRMCMC